MTLRVERCCELIDREIARLAEVTSGVDPATPVPTCGEWTVADLLTHTGEVFLWAARTVREQAQRRIPRDEVDWGVPADPVELPAWIAAGAPTVLGAFRDADPAAPMWAWGWPKDGSFWPRRMVHEIGVHRADAELAVGLVPAFEPEVAADGVEELLDNLPQAAYFAPSVASLRGSGTLDLHAPDAGASWLITLVEDGFTWERTESVGTDVEVTAPAGELLLAMYGRPAAIEVGGDLGLWERWIRDSAI
jgi:uncharacterized protein (TIGR03083 family)